MMKKRIYIILLVTVICIISFIGYTYKQAKTFHTALQKIIFLQSDPMTEGYFNTFFIQEGKYPNSIDTIVSIFIKSGAPQDFIEQYFVDPLCNNGHAYLHYVPLYKKSTKRYEGFLLLSTGIDGKIDNVFNDTVYIDTDVNLKLYNVSDTCFNIFRKWFGKKDILLFWQNGREILKEYAGYEPFHTNNRSMQDIVDFARNLRNRPNFVMNADMTNYHMSYKEKIVKKDSSLYFRYHELLIKNEAFDLEDYQDICIGDSVLFAGILTGWANDSTIQMTHCIPVEILYKTSSNLGLK